MKLQPILAVARLGGALFIAAGSACATLHADVIQTVTGSIIHGMIVASDSGVIKVDTDFAGTIAIKQDQVVTIKTDDNIYVALADGNIVNGRIETGAAGVRVTGPKASLTTIPTAINALWRDGDKSPAEKAADALRRKWGRELAFDLNGRSGNTDRTFLGISVRAVLQGAADRLMLFGNFSRSEQNDTTTQDEAKAGVDYSSFFTPRMSWYVRTELGYDHPKDLDLRSQTAGGIGYSFIKRPTRVLEGRFGISYRFESYGNPLTSDFEAAGFDLGLMHTLDTHWGRLTQRLSLTPSFEDLGNFVFSHDSSLELPIKGDKPWKVRVGVKSEYSSEPPAGLEKLDWTYYTQLVLSWK